MERFYVYTLLSLRDGEFYTGFTMNLKERLRSHALGEVKSTKHRRPLRLIRYEYFANREDAEARERFLKSGFGRKQLKQALKRTLELVREIPLAQT
ncbi:MAG: GIY-YIG nuclease family protein [Candidatus Liptonbacteria bacterium]|nr:GIY-YIG nuclease family protein [Candidatus Liptonbacteria bacterium]